jgi:transposase
MVIAVVVHAANIQDRDGAKLVFATLADRFPRLKLVWADGGYAGKLIAWVKDSCSLVLQIVKRTDDVKGFKVLPRRWVVERTFGWLGRCRRLSKDYEQNTKSSEAMIYIAMIGIMMRRLARCGRLVVLLEALLERVDAAGEPGDLRLDAACSLLARHGSVLSMEGRGEIARAVQPPLEQVV